MEELSISRINPNSILPPKYPKLSSNQVNLTLSNQVNPTISNQVNPTSSTSLSSNILEPHPTSLSNIVTESSLIISGYQKSIMKLEKRVQEEQENTSISTKKYQTKINKLRVNLKSLRMESAIKLFELEQENICKYIKNSLGFIIINLNLFSFDILHL